MPYTKSAKKAIYVAPYTKDAKADNKISRALICF
jgi:hypothetical protein